MFLFAVIALYKIVTSPLGLIFKLIRENASRAEAIGYNVRFYKLISFSNLFSKFFTLLNISIKFIDNIKCNAAENAI